MVYAIAFNNPWGDKIITGSFDKTCKLWNAEVSLRGERHRVAFWAHALPGVATGRYESDPRAASQGVVDAATSVVHSAGGKSDAVGDRSARIHTPRRTATGFCCADRLRLTPEFKYLFARH